MIPAFKNQSFDMREASGKHSLVLKSNLKESKPIASARGESLKKKVNLDALEMKNIPKRNLINTMNML